MRFKKEILDSRDYLSERFTKMQAYLDLCLLAMLDEQVAQSAALLVVAVNYRISVNHYF